MQVGIGAIAANDVDVWCTRCGPGSLDESAVSLLMGGGCHIEVDYWGDARSPVKSDFPAPEPHTAHGVRMRHIATGTEFHCCGSFAG